MTDAPTLVRFYMGWHHGGETDPKTGLPHYRRQLMIRLERPPYLSITRVADEQDQMEFEAPYKLFQKEDQGRKQTDGYPLAYWPACDEGMLQMLAGHDIFTVEDLARLSARRADQTIPPEIRELAMRAQQMIGMQKDTGKFEAIITTKDAELAAYKEQVADLERTVAAMKDTIEMLKKMKAA
jgi:hypothetical protein